VPSIETGAGKVRSRTVKRRKVLQRRPTRVDRWRTLAEEKNDRDDNQMCGFIGTTAHFSAQALTKRQAHEKISCALHKTSREKRKVHARILPFKGETKNA
jgi:hypothetical protein